MALSRLQQIVIYKEATEATGALFSTLFDAQYAKYLIIDPSLDLSVNVFERNIKRGSLTRLQSLTGTKTGTVRFSMELTGDTATSPDTFPAWGLPLQACGFRQEKLIKLTISAWGANPFYHGATITQGSAVGTVIGTTYPGEPVIWVAQENRLGHTAAGNITAFAAGAVSSTVGSTTSTATVSGTAGTTSGQSITAPAGFAWFPVSYPLSKMTATPSSVLNVGQAIYGSSTGAVGVVALASSSGVSQEVYFRRISGHFTTADTILDAPGGSSLGTISANASQFTLPTLSIGMAKDGVRESVKAARGNVSFAGRIGEPLIMTFEFQGGLNLNSGAPAQDAGNLTGVTYSAQIPPVLIDADIKHGKTATSYTAMYGPCISQFDLTIGNEISFRECMADAAGIQETIISARTPTVSLDPELVTEGTWDYLTQFTGNTGSRISFDVGADLKNKFQFKLGGVNWTGVATGDRNGIATRQLTGALNGGSQSVGATSDDNELILIYQIL